VQLCQFVFQKDAPSIVRETPSTPVTDLSTLNMEMRLGDYHECVVGKDSMGQDTGT
jgi:hypothetical protein